MLKPILTCSGMSLLAEVLSVSIEMHKGGTASKYAARHKALYVLHACFISWMSPAREREAVSVEQCKSTHMQLHGLTIGTDNCTGPCHAGLLGWTHSDRVSRLGGWPKP